MWGRAMQNDPHTKNPLWGPAPTDLTVRYPPTWSGRVSFRLPRDLAAEVARARFAITAVASC